MYSKSKISYFNVCRWTKSVCPSISTELLFLMSASVTRFDEISPLWHGVKYFGHFERVKLVFGKIFTLLMLILHAIGQSFIAVNGQKLNIQSINLVTPASTVTKQEIIIAFCFIKLSWPKLVCIDDHQCDQITTIIFSYLAIYNAWKFA